jgi:predicted transcriptional regulator
MHPRHLNYATMSYNDLIKARYNVEVKNRFELLAEDTSKSKYEIFKEAITQTAKEIIPVKQRKTAQKWMTDEILSLMDERRKVKGRNPHEYQTLNKTVHRKCLEAKEN